MNSNKNLDLARKAFPYNEDQRVAYMLGLEKGYDQAMKDFLEKAYEWLEDQVCYYSSWEYNGDTYEREIVVDTDKMIEQFKNYMKDESEN